MDLIKEIKKLKKEIELLKKLDPPNIIKYYTSFRDNDNVYIFIEYINNGNLKTLMKKKENDYLNKKRFWII